MTFRKTVVAALTVAGLALGVSVPEPAAAASLAPHSALNIGNQQPVLRIDHRRGHYRNYGRHYHNGHRGHRKHRRGYRHYNGWRYPPAAFSFRYRVPPQRYIAPPPLVIVPPRYVQHLPTAHYHWCDRRYRSYRAPDNSFQPYHGPRRACVSPFGP